jgi:hypothetical protein
MERVAFLVEHTGDRLGCLLNPESVVTRRLAGVRARHSTSGSLTVTAAPYDPLLYTGGGSTELVLDLLFDVTLAGSSITTSDVRDLTRPLSELAEGGAGDGPAGAPPVVRLLWGKHWNIRAVVVAVAERLEQFTTAGAPQRSWLRMRLVRVSEPAARTMGEVPHVVVPAVPEIPGAAIRTTRIHEVLGGGDVPAAGGAGERLDEIAYRHFRDPRLWRAIAAFNDIEDPLHIAPGRILGIPPTA